MLRSEPGEELPAEAARRRVPPSLSAMQFRQAVLSIEPRTAVFDCDGTLWSGDSGYGFMVWSMAEGLVSRNASDWIDSRYRLYRAGEISELSMCGEMTQLYAGLREEELRSAAEVFVKTHVEANIFPELESLVAELTDTGTEIWAVSSTNHWIIEEGVRRFRIPAERVLCARVRVKEGIATDELLSVPTDELKASALVGAGLPHPDAVFGNSIHDAAMLSIARHAFPVNPTPGLTEVAAIQGWSLFYPAAVLRDSKT